MPQPIRDHFATFQQIIPYLPAGDLAEFGVYEGGTTAQLASFGRKVWAFDTFSGIPKEDFDPRLDFQNRPHKFECDPREWLTALGNIECIAGRFAETLPGFRPQVRFAFAYVDCDLYASYKQVLEFLDNRIVPGGCFLCDDASCEGALMAMKEFIAEHDWNADPYFEIFRRSSDQGQDAVLAVP